MKSNKCMVGLLMLLMVIGLFAVQAAAADQDVVVFAAASTTNALTDIGELYAAQGAGQIKTSFASSSTLAKQIASGAPADVYLSANKKWMDFLEKKNAVDKATRFDLLGNRIVLIAPLKSSIDKVEVNELLDLATLLGSDGRLSMGDPDHVPAGMYGKKAMQKLGLWTQVQGRLAPMKDVRAALVHGRTRRSVPLGLVYATDAAISTKVRVVGVFPHRQPSAHRLSRCGIVAGGTAADAAELLSSPSSKSADAKASICQSTDLKCVHLKMVSTCTG